MTRIRENHFAGLHVVSQEESRRILNLAGTGEERVVEFPDENRLVPGVDMLPERILQPPGNGSDDFTVAGDIRQDNTGDRSLTANRQIVQIAALGCGSQRLARNPRRQSR
jgi:hypothetical protein